MSLLTRAIVMASCIIATAGCATVPHNALPDDPKDLFAKAYHSYLAHDYTTATSLFTACIEGIPERLLDHDAFALLSQCKYLSGDTAAGRTVLENGIELCARVKSDMYPDAAQDLRDWLRDYPRLPDSLTPQGGFVLHDTMPVMIHMQAPIYPDEARQKAEEGEVRIAVLLDSSGAVTKLEVRKSASDSIDAAALRAASGCRFTPLLHHGRPVACWVFLPYRFSLT